MRKLLSLVLALAMAMSLVAVAGAEAPTDLPRNETVYSAGWQYGPIVGYNPLSSNMNNALAVSASAARTKLIMFESLYMYNMLDGGLYPLLADGDYVWNDDMTEMTVKMNAAAKWSDGTPVTAEDVQATWDVSMKIQNGFYISYGSYIDSVTAVDGNVVIKAKLNEDGKPANPLQVLCYLVGTYVCQKDWIDTVMARNNEVAADVLNDPAEDVPYSGPYGPYIANDQLVAFVRNDNYWGQDESMWGKLPTPKYVAHTIYTDNDASAQAFIDGQIDVNQSFIANVQKLWEEQDLPIATYYTEPPYQLCATMPTAWYNMENEFLQVKEIRKAIAWAVDYPSIIENAMTNQSPTFEQVPRSVMNPTDGEQALYNQAEVADLQWAGNDIEGAKALLDAAGIVDTDGDGYREYNGKKVTLNACCPNGWTDWQAAMQLVAEAGQAIGLDVTTNFPEWSIYQTVFTKASQTEYDIFMYSPPGADPSAPWSRVRAFMSSEFIGQENNWAGNYGHWTNERADEIIAAIPQTTDEEELKALYTEATKIYLEEVPSFSLMYRPTSFHSVNESVWTNWPEATMNAERAEQGLYQIPPADAVDSLGIAALYFIELAE